MEFYSNTRRTPRMQETFTNKEQQVYKTKIDPKTGKRILSKTEKVNIYDQIQEYAEEVKISNMIQRYGINTNNQLEKSEQKLIDLTNMPENLIETMAIIDNAKEIWNKQSKEIKQKFNNDFKQFIAGSENGQIVNILNEQLGKEHKQPNLPTYQELYNTVQTQKANIEQLKANNLQAQQTIQTQQQIQTGGNT